MQSEKVILLKIIYYETAQYKKCPKHRSKDVNSRKGENNYVFLSFKKRIGVKVKKWPIYYERLYKKDCKFFSFVNQHI